VVVIGEVIEHLDNPGAALRNLHGLLAPGGQLVTVPNAFSLSGIARVLLGRETTHPEHATHHSFVTLQRLLAMNGMPPSEVLWYRWARYGGSRLQRAKRAAAAAVSARSRSCPTASSPWSGLSAPASRLPGAPPDGT
jgi:hypothetical protein